MKLLIADFSANVRQIQLILCRVFILRLFSFIHIHYKPYSEGIVRFSDSSSSFFFFFFFGRIKTFRAADQRIPFALHRFLRYVQRLADQGHAKSAVWLDMLIFVHDH